MRFLKKSGTMVSPKSEKGENEMETEITKDMLIGDLMQLDMGIMPVLMAAGMYCVTCPASQMESIEEAAWVHGIDADSLIEVINEYFELKAEEEKEAEEAAAQDS